MIPPLAGASVWPIPAIKAVMKRTNGVARYESMFPPMWDGLSTCNLAVLYRKNIDFHVAPKCYINSRIIAGKTILLCIRPRSRNVMFKERFRSKFWYPVISSSIQQPPLVSGERYYRRRRRGGEEERRSYRKIIADLGWLICKTGKWAQ